jgi:hypothetical protein
MVMEIEFSKVWGQDDCRWNFCGGDWNFRTMAGLMTFYGIKEARIIGREIYYENERSKIKVCNVYSGLVTINIK